MKKQNTLRRLLALLCCTAMLLPCVPATLAAGGALLEEGFESYADYGELSTTWKKHKNTKDEEIKISKDKAFSGKQSVLIDDAEGGKAAQISLTMSTGAPKGTEIIMSAKYFVETLDGSGTPWINLYTDKSNFAYTTSDGKWDSVSIIMPTTTDNQEIGAVLGSNAGTVSKTYWDDVRVHVLTEELALQYVDEQLALAEPTGLYAGLGSKALGLSDVREAMTGTYAQALKDARQAKGAALTKAEVQACVGKANAGGVKIPPLIQDDFESYTSSETLLTNWKKGSASHVDEPQLGTDQAVSGKQSLLIDDTTGSSAAFAKRTVTAPGPKGTELILTAKHFTESLDGSAKPYINLYAGGNNKVFTTAMGEWATISIVAVTTADDQDVAALMGSDASPKSKSYWDDVSLQLLTEELAVAYINEKISIPNFSSATELMPALGSKALGLDGVQTSSGAHYIKVLKEALAKKGAPLTKAEMQDCVDNATLDALAAEFDGTVLYVGATGDIPATVKGLPASATAKWTSVSPAGKNITLSNGKATAAALPTGADDVYSAVMRLSTATKSVDVNYTIRLMSAEGYDQKDTNDASAELVTNTVIGTAKTGTVSAPKVSVSGVNVAWDRIESDPNGFVSVANGQLTVNKLPTGMEYYEAVVVLKLTKGDASAELEYNIVAYDDNYRILIPMYNPGFEAVDKDGKPLGWVPLNTTANGFGEGSTADARTGTHSFHFVDGDPNSNYGYRSETKASPAKPGYEYELGFWAKGTATSPEANRAGMAIYLEFILDTGKKAGQAAGDAIAVNPNEWTLVSHRGTSLDGTAFIRHMPYGYVSTVCDLLMDDFRTWELTGTASALLTDELLTGKGDADALYSRLGIASMGISGLISANKADYLKSLTAKRAAKGSALTAAEMAAVVAEVNVKAGTEYKAQLNKLAGQINTTMTITQPGVIELPDVGDSTVTVKYTKVTGTGASRMALTGLGAKVNSVPEYGSKNETAKLVLTMSKGSATVDVNITVTLKAYTKEMSTLIFVAEDLDINDYLNGQPANCVTDDLGALPSSLGTGISVKWQALDSDTLETSKVVTAKGKVTRPAYGEADAAVALRATLSKSGEKYDHDLYFIVAAEGVEEARTVITRNTDFEKDIPVDEFTAPDGWLKSVKWEYGRDMLQTSYANIDTGVAFGGKQSLRITADGKLYDAQDTIKSSVMNAAVTTAREGYTYRLDVMAYTDAEATVPTATIRFWDNAGLEISNATAAYATAPGGRGVWKNLSVSAVAPAGTVMITAELDGGDKVGVTYFDDVRLREWPIVPNNSFELGTLGWTTGGKVSDGKLTLAAGQTAESVVRGADRGVTYYLSLEADGGKAALRFVDASGKTLAEYAKDMQSGLNAFFAYAPADTAGVQVVLTGAMTADNVKIIRSAAGASVTDGDFEISANAGVGTPWELTNATIAPNTGKTGAGVTVKGDGQAVSTFIPVQDGKGYVFAVDVKGKGGQMQVQLRNYLNMLANRPTAVSESDDWTTLIISYDELVECVDKSVGEHAYAQIVLSGDAIFDNARVYSISKNVSNYSVEDIKITPYGTFPYNWSSYGKAGAYMDNQPGQYTNGVKGLAVELFGLGEGGVRSSFLQDIKSGKAYEASLMAKGTGAKLFVEFWDQDFNKLGSEFVTIDSADWKEYSVVGTAPSGTIYASLSVGGDGVGAAVIDEAYLLPVVRSIGNNVQTFIDNWLIADSQNVERTFYKGERVAQGSLHGGYVNIHWDEKEQIYKMWHRAGDYGRYRTSKDGINWSEPIICYDTETGAECVGGYVVIDDDDPDVTKRYKGIFWRRAETSALHSYDYFYSADGINWTRHSTAKIGYDVHTVMYDPINDEYVLTYKFHVVNPLRGQTFRVQNIAVSKDMVNWTGGVRQYTVGTPMDTVETDMIRTDGYGNGIYALGDSYVSLNWRTLLNDADSFGAVLDSNMLFSRDLTESWQRLQYEDGSAVMAIPRGKAGEPDSAQIYTAAAPIRMGDETWWYYYGESGDHGQTRVPNYAGAYSAYAKWRLNGFASMDFSAGGTLTTEQFTMMGTDLYLNAVGNLTVELLDASGAVVATGKFSGDNVDGIVTWDKSIAGQQGKVVSLRITGSNAKLYTIQWKGSIFSDVASDAWYSRAVHYAVDNGIMGGYGGGKFGPNDKLTRAMVIQMLYNKVGQPKINSKHDFNDVPATEWFNNAVTWGTKNGVMGGYGGGKFGPNDNVTIEQIAVILWNYSGNPEFDAELGAVGSYSGWAKNALTWATDRGVLHGVNFKNATDQATRAQAAQMLTNYLRW